MNIQRKQSALQITTVIIATMLAGNTLTANATDDFKMQIHPRETSGTWALENEKYREAMAFLEGERARSDRGRRNWRPVLTNLCVAHTKLGDYETATHYCDKAVEADHRSGIAFNNRGVLAALKGDFAAAAADFDSALARRGSAEYTNHNIQRLGDQISDEIDDSTVNVAEVTTE